MDNIYSVISSQKTTSGNETATISDHLLQFLISPNTFADPPFNKSDRIERDWSI